MIVCLEFLLMYKDFDFLMLELDFHKEKIFHFSHIMEEAYKME